MPTAVALIVFGTLCRLVAHPPNFGPFGARLDALVKRERSGAGARPPRVG